MLTSLIISKKLICVTPIQRLVIGSCKHYVIELGQLSQRYKHTTRKSLFSQLSQLFRPWTVGTMDRPNNCPNMLNIHLTMCFRATASERAMVRVMLNRLVGTLSLVSKDDCPNIWTYYDFLLGTIVPSRIVVVCSGPNT